MNKIIRSWLGLGLVLVLCMGMLPMTAFAEEPEEENTVIAAVLSEEEVTSVDEPETEVLTEEETEMSASEEETEEALEESESEEQPEEILTEPEIAEAPETTEEPEITKEPEETEPASEEEDTQAEEPESSETPEDPSLEEETSEEENVELQELSDGFNLVDGVWGWYQDGTLQTKATGMVKGTIQDKLGWYYVRQGLYLSSATGITKKVDTSKDTKWYYVSNGKYAPQFTGFAHRANGTSPLWFYVKKGVFQSGKGIVQGQMGQSKGWYYIEKGVFTPVTGLTQKADHSTDERWYYIENGVFVKGIAVTQRVNSSDGQWYYVQNGLHNRSTGMAKGTINGVAGWYYFKQGVYNQGTGLTRKIDRSKDANWYYVKNGKLSLLTGFAQRADGSSDAWFYVKKGVYTRSTGIAKGVIDGVSGWYYAKNGIFTTASTVTSLIENPDGKLYYVSNGQFREVTCLLKRQIDGTTSWWYFNKGALDRTYSGTFTDGIRTYTIVNGQATDCNYYFITDMIELPSGGYNLSTANIGLKVMKVNQKLLGSNSGYYTSATSNAVWSFQASHGLPATGVVDYNTWIALGYSAVDWYNLGTYVTPMKTNELSTRQERIQAMLQTAAEYAAAGTWYNDGCSGYPGSYVDCSGLIFQCLYSAGINPNVNIVMHALAQYEYSSTYLAADPWLGLPVSTNSLQAGDLVFYGNNGSGNVNHVAIYAGNGLIYDSYPNRGVTLRSQYIPGQYIIKAVRVF